MILSSIFSSHASHFVIVLLSQYLFSEIKDEAQNALCYKLIRENCLTEKFLYQRMPFGDDLSLKYHFAMKCMYEDPKQALFLKLVTI